MCFKLHADSLLINCFYECRNRESITLRDLQEIAQMIVHECNYSIITDISYGVVVEAVNNYSDFISADRYTFHIKPQAREDKRFSYLTEISRKYMPNKVKDVMLVALKNHISYTEQHKL